MQLSTYPAWPGPGGTPVPALPCAPQAPQPPPSPKVNSTVLYISNLHWWTTDATVETAAAAYGPLVSCRFLEERVSGKSRGTACVEFADPEAAKRCKAELHG